MICVRACLTKAAGCFGIEGLTGSVPPIVRRAQIFQLQGGKDTTQR
jgi:hypothetical protein